MTLIMKAVEFDKLPSGFKKQYAGPQALYEAGWFLQPKYDGCFGMAVMQEDLEDCRMLSRTGEDYTVSCAHIIEQLWNGLRDADMRAPVVILGEVWHPQWEFPKISGHMRKHSLSSELVFVMCDILPGLLETDVPYSFRLGQVDELWLACGSSIKSVRTLAHYEVEDLDVDKHATSLKAGGGFDGAILRDPTAGYTIGLVKRGEIVKVKPLTTLDLICTATATEPGEKTGRPVVTLCVQYRGVETWVGSGVPHDLDPATAAGKIVEVACLGVTEAGALREPRFIGIRHDKKEPDA